jgi:UDP-N-acetylglucosamine 4,6-dehydratase
MRKVLITGGTGFLGKRLGRRLKESGFEVILGGRNQKLAAAAEKFSGCTSVPLDVSRIESLRDVISVFAPDIVVHAAATKYVDKAELYPHEAIDINIIGSQNVARVAMERKVDLVLGISTDKAAPPVRNTYGLTKAVMERLFCSLDGQSDTRFLCVRYGNVAWSTGSVLVAWKHMLDTSGVISTTGPEMTRFFFSIDEAVQLVVTGIVNSEKFHGQVLAREMKSAKLEHILHIWTGLTGGTYQKVGGRPGERSYEYLVGELELQYVNSHDIDGIKHYSINFNSRSHTALPNAISSDSADRLSDLEITELILNPPSEDI